MITHVCAACGYPTVGPDMCFYCRPVLAKTVPPFPSSLGCADADAGLLVLNTSA